MRYVRSLLMVALFWSTGLYAASWPAVSEKYPNYRYPGTINTVSGINFNEFTLRIASETYRLRNGRYARETPGDAVSLQLMNHWIIRGVNPGSDFVVIHWSGEFTGGSTSVEQGVQVLAVERGVLTLKQTLSYSGKNIDAKTHFNPASGRLSIICRDEDDGGGRCCPRYRFNAEYKWVGNKFKLISTRKLPLKRN